MCLANPARLLQNIQCKKPDSGGLALDVFNVSLLTNAFHGHPNVSDASPPRLERVFGWILRLN